MLYFVQIDLKKKKMNTINSIEFKQLNSQKVVNTNGPIIKMFNERSADISSNTGLLTPDRVESVSSTPVWPLRTCFMFRTTQSKRIKVNHFVKPLATTTWYLTLVFMLMAIYVFAAVLVVEWKYDKFQRYSDAVLFAVGSLCQQGLII